MQSCNSSHNECGSVKKSVPTGFRKVWVPDKRNPKKFRLTYEAVEPLVIALQQQVKDSLSENFYWSSIDDCVGPHLRSREIFRQRYKWKIDLSNAFGHVTPIMIQNILGRDHEVSQIISLFERYFFHINGGLIQGAPASPIIFEIVMRKLIDHPLLAAIYSDMPRLICTRFRDDFLISSPQWITKWQRKRILRLIRDVGFTINLKKLQLIDNQKNSIVFLGVMIKNGHAIITDEFFVRYSSLCLYERSTWNYKYRLKGMDAWRHYVQRMNYDVSRKS